MGEDPSSIGLYIPIANRQIIKKVTSKKIIEFQVEGRISPKL